MIDPVTGAGLAGALSDLTAAMAEQTLYDAYNEYITDHYNIYDPALQDPYIPIGYGTKIEATPAVTGDTDDTISDSSETDPVDAWHDYIENETGKVSDITGGIVSGSNSSAFNYSLLEKPDNSVAAVAPVAVPLDWAYVAISKAMGVAMDITEISPELGLKLGNALIAAGCVYDASKNLVNAWWDGVKMLFPKSAVDAVQGVLDEEGIGGDAEYNLDFSDVDKNPMYDPTYAGPIHLYGNYQSSNREGDNTILSSTAPYSVFLGSGWETSLLFISTTPFTVDRLNGYPYHWDYSTPYTKDGISYYWGHANFNNRPVDYEVTQVPATYHGYWDMCYLIFNGTVTQSGYPEGTAEAHSTHYTPSTIPSGGGIAISDTDTIPVVPINLPDDPTNTIGDAVDPTTGSTTPEQEDGLPAPPVPLPIPDTKPSNPNVPLVNPSIVDSTLVEELVEELANTLDPQAPQSSGLIPVPDLPGIGDPPTFPSIIPTSGPGFIHVYNPTPSEFVAFGTWLWVTYADATIDKILNNPFDGVIGAHELYATPNTDGSDNIRSAFLTCPTTAALVPNRYSEIDCGTVVIPEFYGNYLDYSPYSQAYIYLPFIGINEVSIDDIVGHAVNIRYRVDSYSGSCIAMIFVAKDDYQNLCYQFAGSCSVEVPMAGGSQAAIKAGEMQAEAYSRAGIANAALNGAAAIGSGLASGGLAGGLLGGLSALGGIAGAWYSGQRSIDAARVANKSTVQHSGQFGASHGAMSKKEPFIIIRNPIQVKVTNYNEDYGFPAHKRVIVGGCRGYLRVREVNVVSAHATDEEKMAIESALKNGVYVS